MYDLHSEFDIQKHKQKYVNYLEVVIHKDGSVHYAIPSHQEYVIALCCKQKNITRDELNDLCPEEYYFDFMTWLCGQSDAIAVWSEFIVYANIYSEQIETLKKLAEEGLYSGSIPSSPVKNM